MLRSMVEYSIVKLALETIFDILNVQLHSKWRKQSLGQSNEVIKQAALLPFLFTNRG